MRLMACAPPPPFPLALTVLLDLAAFLLLENVPPLRLFNGPECGRAFGQPAQ
jgi:hypothetical protein